MKALNLLIGCFKYRNGVVEFWLDKFNEAGLEKAFETIVLLYNEILHKDSNWHYFYEGDYSLIRCSLKYADKVKDFFDKQGIMYRPPTAWRESTHMTSNYKDAYQRLFHDMCVLTIKMYKNADGRYLYQAADRIIHPFLNNALYLACIDGQMAGYEEAGLSVEEWESAKMADLARGRCVYIGNIIGQKLMLKKLKDYEEANSKKEGLANSE